MNGSSLPTVKAEPADGLSGAIKPDPDAAAESDDDLYEDAGDLDFSKSQLHYLMKVPKWLWESWATIDDDEEIRLGSIKVETIGSEQKMSLHLAPDVVPNKTLPKQYSMNVTSTDSQNTYVFAEKDLPGYAHLDGRTQPRRDPSRQQFRDKGPDQKNNRFQPYYRRAIPKHTSLAGIVRHEINCTPVDNADFREFERRRTMSAFEKQKPGVQYLKNDNLFIPTKTVDNREFGTFTKTGPVKPRPQENKSARIPQNELLDLIFDCFKKYRYWSLKSLKAELKQPEAYLKSTLEMVAELVKTGRFAMTWTLKPESQHEQYAEIDIKEEQAPDMPMGLDGAADEEDAFGDDDDEDEENVKMEDAL